MAVSDRIDSASPKGPREALDPPGRQQGLLVDESGSISETARLIGPPDPQKQSGSDLSRLRSDS